MEYFWFYRPEVDWPPEGIEQPSALTSHSRLNVACTQTRLPPSVQRRVVRTWCELLPTLEGVEFLWFSSRVPQDLFDAACRVPKLKGLYVKWSGIKSMEAIQGATSLRYFHLGGSAGLRSIEPLRSMTKLQWLGLENIQRISCLEPLATLTRLEGLSVDGGMWATQRVDTLAPIGRLEGLKYLSIVNLRARDKTLEPLFALERLQAFHSAQWWKAQELVELRRRNPGLAV